MLIGQEEERASGWNSRHGTARISPLRILHDERDAGGHGCGRHAAFCEAAPDMPCAPFAATRPPAAVLGIDTTFYKVLAFAISALFSGMAGSIYIFWVGYIEPGQAFDMALNIQFVMAGFWRSRVRDRAAPRGGGAPVVLGIDLEFTSSKFIWPFWVS